MIPDEIIGADVPIPEHTPGPQCGECKPIACLKKCGGWSHYLRESGGWLCGTCGAAS